MNRYGHPDTRWRHLRQIGRFGFALAAGGAFAALSWTPAPPAEQNADNTNTPSSSHPFLTERSGVVTEDGASSHYTLPAYGIEGEDQWGLTRDRTALDLSDRGPLLGSNAALEAEEHARTVPAMEGIQKTTAFQQPRGPP